MKRGLGMGWGERPVAHCKNVSLVQLLKFAARMTVDFLSKIREVSLSKG